MSCRPVKEGGASGTAMRLEFAQLLHLGRSSPERGVKNVHETGGGSGREYITILACGSAIGEKLPPYNVYKGKHLMTNHTQGEPPGTRYSMSDSGWMEGANFIE